MKQSSVHPSPLQLKLRDFCIKLETRFLQSDRRMPFAAKFTPAALLLAAALFLKALPVPIAAVLTAIAGFALTESAVRRLRDIGFSANKVLHIIIPLFVCWWIGPKIPDTHLLRESFIALLCAYPALLIVRLYFAAGKPACKA